ncbi:uridine kinase family protein [Acaryochloris marina]|uniref:UDP-N-acetylglucosamine kinase n=1 Tax=Acaryochloris marina (strain MBIC 11017) TaxID=329726 RepID=A8ZL90_ACAM1|nr:zeta toxin family protein [Acaryochloris marina]ABW31917.1 uridine kinase [Acaryochloris marina MBIC11017]BDM82922.1 uridine kinase [Acaryochloris marina MBIC10699]
MTTPKIIGIAGGSGAGKTTLAQALVDRLSGQALLISHDSYYRYMPCGNYDLPESLDTDMMIAHLERLRSGYSVDLPIYDMIANSRKAETIQVHPHPFIIVEGIFVLTLPEILECLDFKIYVETPDDLRMKRRIARDSKEKLRTKTSVIQEWQSNVMPTHKELVMPGASVADLVVSGETAVGEIVQKILGEVKPMSLPDHL